jgi:hypothetical protein
MEFFKGGGILELRILTEKATEKKKKKKTTQEQQQRST